jgi:hypothetical protein
MIKRWELGRAARWLGGLACLGAGLGASLCATPAFAGPEVGVSVVISQPGVYGRVDIGRFPEPEVIVAQPMIVRQVRVRPEPVYMWVPPGHQRRWSKECWRYKACGVPVYFVRDNWYRDHVRHEKHESHESRGPDRRDERNGHERHDDRRGEGHGQREHGHGRGH